MDRYIALGIVQIMQIAGAIFDLDGTIVNTLPIVIESFHRAIRRFVDRTYTDDEITALFGPTEAGVLQRVIPNHWQEGLAVYVNEYERLYAQKLIGPFPGIEDALRLLKGAGVRTAVVTGKGADSTAFSLKQSGLDGYFDLVQAGSPDGPVKPSGIQEVLNLWGISPKVAFYLGDSPSDIQDARRVGVIPLGAAWSVSSNLDVLNAQNPLAVFDTPQGFVNWITRNLT
ncbi:MAG: HAD hydrolase-like protein [Methanothrix sp.]|nr:HAD hydrolase-like protein [Methanothrix sp.]